MAEAAAEAARVAVEAVGAVVVAPAAAATTETMMALRARLPNRQDASIAIRPGRSTRASVGASHLRVARTKRIRKARISLLVARLVAEALAEVRASARIRSYRPLRVWRFRMGSGILRMKGIYHL